MRDDMTPGDRTESDLATMRALHREASDRIDPPPDPGVRAAVLSAATKAVADSTRRASGNPFGAARWPLSMAAVLVVSVMAGLVATRTMRDEPERVAPVAATPSSTVAAAKEPEPTVVAEAARSEPPMKASADLVASRSIDDARARGPHRPKIASPPAAPSNQTMAPAEFRAAIPTRQEAFAERLDAPPSPAPAPAAEAAAPPRQAPSSDASSRRVFAQRMSAEPPTPEAWVERIVTLRDAGRAAEADRELAALRLRYPDFAIPQTALGATGTR